MTIKPVIEFKQAEQPYRECAACHGRAVFMLRYGNGYGGATVAGFCQKHAAELEDVVIQGIEDYS